ncbi:peptidyl-tRNA hydrolase [Scheffersomyces amazonensis]|uniref:peptidyl-tRNA hydrolase n=1 Tax=Scheffersomyces amazonensis TaxID=1078765 RepID=UPI00315D7FDF
MDKTLIIFSVGNPGASNRHSTGHYMLKKLVDYFDVKQLTKKSPMYSVTSNADNSLILAKSNIYMNDSGKAFSKFIEGERIRLNSSCIILILYDDFESKLGTIKLLNLKSKESHNGLKSIRNSVNDPGINEVVFKLAIGIGPKPNNASKQTMASWVLSDFNSEEHRVLESAAFDALTTCLGEIIELNGEINDCNKFNAHLTKVLRASV